jgi:hypothetical protein
VGHGGKRTKSGRKPSAVTVKTREIAEREAKSGEILPLEVILDNMRFFHTAAAIALNKLLAQETTPEAVVMEHDPKAAGGDQPVTMLKAYETLLDLRDRAGKAAVDAAPYIHARISATEGGEKANTDFVPLAERIKEYERLAAIEDADNVVEMKR